MARPLTTQLDEPESRPYFLWDEDISIAQLRAVLSGPAGPVWLFVSPSDVAEALPRIRRRLGRRFDFGDG